MNKRLLIGLSLCALACKGRVPDKISAPKDMGLTKDKKVSVYTTAANTALRLSLTGTVPFHDLGQPKETQICIFVDPAKTFQDFVGIGGALTDAAAETFAKLPAARQVELLRAYFDKKSGNAYTMARTNINSCDFSSESYTYIQEGDSSLKSFTIAHDKKFKIPFIKRVMAAAGGKIDLFASPWSPPAFMKTNDDMLHGGELEPVYYNSWANYYTRFIKAYEAEGIPIWGITIQNEPMATQTWESCIYSGEEERDFLKNNLGPAMNSAGLGAVKIIGWDHNRDLLYQRASALLSDPAAAKYLWGIGIHWYEPWSGGTPMFDNVKLVHETFPGTHLIFTEGCSDAFDSSKINSWQLGEKYGTNMIHDFNNGTVAWTDWNILLDEKGGPNHVGNYCFAPIHANTKTGDLIYTSSYYYIGHFSRFIHPGAKRIISSSSRSSLETTAFLNPDGTVATVVMNSGDSAIDYFLWVDGRAAEVQSLPHSIQTLVF